MRRGGDERKGGDKREEQEIREKKGRWEIRKGGERNEEESRRVEERKGDERRTGGERRGDKYCQIERFMAKLFNFCRFKYVPFESSAYLLCPAQFMEKKRSMNGMEGNEELEASIILICWVIIIICCVEHIAVLRLSRWRNKMEAKMWEREREENTSYIFWIEK